MIFFHAAFAPSCKMRILANILIVLTIITKGDEYSQRKPEREGKFLSPALYTGVLFPDQAHRNIDFPVACDGSEGVCDADKKVINPVYSLRISLEEKFHPFRSS